MTHARTAILVVDDEEIVRESLGGWLEKDGYEVESAPDGAAARPWWDYTAVRKARYGVV